MLSRNEAQTRHDLIDPALESRGWARHDIRVEETARAIDFDPVTKEARRRLHGRTDYVLRRPLEPGAEPLPLAILEAKREKQTAEHGLAQAQDYRIGHLHHVPFVFSTNGHLFVEFDAESATVSEPRPLSEFPAPEELIARYLQARGLPHDAAALTPLLRPYHTGRDWLRYYQDAAIRAALEKIVRERAAGNAPRVLLSLATGAGKTRLAAALLRRLFDAGLLGKGLFLSDRSELRENSINDFQEQFGADAAIVGKGKPQKNAKVLIATYQTLDKDTAGVSAQQTFFAKHYPQGFFDVILVDECHRSAWGDWHDILSAHPRAIIIGLTATPRELDMPAGADENDQRRLADNFEYFGEPVYEYPYLQGVEDGYLAPPDIEQYDLYHERQQQPERVRGVPRQDLAGKKITELLTGARVAEQNVPQQNQGGALESRLFLPERIKAMCGHLFDRLCATGDGGSPLQKTIVFCASDHHADLVANELNNRYSAWLKTSGAKRARKFAFKCTASAHGQKMIPDFRGSGTSWFIACTKDLLSTGVDVPCVRNVVFFRYVQSPILLTQMVGRGTRLHAESGKLIFRIFDYTGATALLGSSFKVKPPSAGDDQGGTGTPRPPKMRATGLTTEVQSAGQFTVALVNGQTQRVTWQQYEQMLIERLLAALPSLVEFRHCWLDPARRHDLLTALERDGLLPAHLQSRRGMAGYDLYDVLASAAYAVPPRTRAERAAAFTAPADSPPWLVQLPQPAAKVIRAIVRQFEKGGTEALDSAQLFSAPEVKAARGLTALRQAGNPHDLLRQTKETLFIA